MSGKLVGEVIDALESGQLNLSSAERLALIAIAEKCHATTRQGSVRTSRIEAAVGMSKRTTERAIAQLKKQGVIWVVKRGYWSHGVARAPIYELVVPATQMAEAPPMCFRQIRMCFRQMGNVFPPRTPLRPAAMKRMTVVTS